jgi:glycosyltransferase involved in cell wall biosynthesis
MRIAIDASPAAKKPRTGTELYTLQLILALAEVDSRNEYALFFNDEIPAELSTLPATFRPQRTRQRWLWAQTRLAWELWKSSPDVFFAPANVVPFLHPARCVTTIHDVAFHYFPECYSSLVRLYLEVTTRFALRHAHTVIAVSEGTKADLVCSYQADPSHIEVIHSGGPALSEESPSPEEVERTLARYGIVRPYLLFLGRLERKKNVARILQAFFQLKERGISHRLVLGGSPGIGFGDIRRLVEGSPFAQDVILTGYVGEEKEALYAGADLFVFPSLYEGFGFPVLEAASHGTPVVTSRGSALAEVAGLAAVLVDPLSVDEIAEAIFKVIHDQAVRTRLVERGYKRLDDFNWRDTAAKVVTVLEAAGKESPV